MDNVKSRLATIGAKMWRYQHFAGLLITLVFFILRFIPGNNEGLATRPADEPVTVAKNGSRVYDIYRGELILRDLALQNSEISLVFYYAPWSKESMDAFKEYELAAEIMHQQVSFTAINCWYIKGTCRGKLQFQDFPHVYLHRRNMKSVVHYGGQLKRDYFLHFLNKVIMPVYYISSVQEGRNWFDRNQFTVAASFEAKHIDLLEDFQRFVIIATRLLEYAALQIEFGVIVNREIAKSLFMKPRILHVRDNMRPTELLKISLKNTTDEIVQKLAGLWKQTVCRDLNFPWVRASYLHDSLTKGPLLAVFVSSPSISERYSYVQKIRQLAMAFYADGKEIKKANASIYANTSECGRCCKTFITKKYSPPIACSVCLKGVSQNHHAKDYARCKFEEYFTAGFDSLSSLEYIHKKVAESSNGVQCIETPLFYGSRYHHAHICCQNKYAFFHGLNSSFRKSHSRVTPKRDALDNLRRKFSMQTRDTISYILADNHDVNALDSTIIRGLSSLTNKTLQFAILDFDYHAALASNMGINRSQIYQEDGTRLGCAILDHVEEKNYVMKSAEFNLEKFIVNYTLGLLPEHLHSTQLAPKCISAPIKPCVQEVSTTTFEEMVLNSEKNVMLVYYLPWCLACTSISHNYLYLSDILHGSSTVLVARIDAYANKLPFPFRVQKFPSVILYPANRSSYSVVFPSDKEINVASLLSFLLHNLPKRDIKQLLLDICIHAKGYPDIQHAACQNYKSFGKEKL